MLNSPFEGVSIQAHRVGARLASFSWVWAENVLDPLVIRTVSLEVSQATWSSVSSHQDSGMSCQKIGSSFISPEFVGQGCGSSGSRIGAFSRDLFSSLSCSQKARRVETGHRSDYPESVPQERSFQDGIPPDYIEDHSSRGLDGFYRFGGHLFSCPHPCVISEVSILFPRTTLLSILMSAVRSDHLSQSVHEDPAIVNCLATTERSKNLPLLRQHPSFTPRQKHSPISFAPRPSYSATVRLANKSREELSSSSARHYMSGGQDTDSVRYSFSSSRRFRSSSIG